MRWRTSLTSYTRTGRGGSRRGLKRVAVVAGLVAMLVVALVSASFAGVFSGSARAATRTPTPARHVATPVRPAAARARTAAAPRTSCTSVAHIGDSTSVGMVSPTWLANPAQRLAAQYRDVGVRHVQIDASGGRSIVEEMPDQINGYKVASAWYQQGFRGCWVIALGTNDTANVAAGSNVGLLARIQEMMAAAHGAPVMWVNTQTDLTSGPWSEANMQAWNNALVQAAKQYPNMRIFNWAGMVQPGWHLSDGIHYTSAGYAIRAAAIAQALTRAFPADGHSTSVIVN
ncbi:MAG TPA: GDSL-type esterase/lipase family protein [Streptosporangiaceae bacterium]|nr:GDSL-type esterase/lipase family protein [Streptosporangiaceae bacterium]